MPETATSEKPIAVPFSDVVAFVRQLSHDLRNHLNAAELQSAYLNEIAADADLKSELQRLRSMLSEMGGSLQRLSAALTQPKPTCMPYEASDFIEDLQSKTSTVFPERKDAVQWQVEAGEAKLEIDPQLLQQSLMELLNNAFLHGRQTEPIIVAARVDGSEFVIELREPKQDFQASTENWGRTPFSKVAQGHYGLGLHKARSIIEAHRGKMDVRYDPASSALITTVTLPVARD